MEFVVAVFIVIWILLYGIENSVTKKQIFSQYAWLARAIKHFLFFGGIGLFILVMGTDWNNRTWEIPIGIILIIIGLGLFGRTFINRKQIQTGLENGTIEPLSD